MLNAHYFIHFASLIAFGAFVHGFTGLGFGIIVIAGLAFTPMNLERASVVLNLLLPILFMVVIWASRRDAPSSIRWKLAFFLFTGAFCGVPLGYLFLYSYGTKPIFYLALGITLFIFSMDYLIRPRIHTKLPLPIGWLAGLAGGFFAGAFTAGGPPVALFLYSHYENPSEAKGTLQMVFLSATWWRLLNIFIFGEGYTFQIFKWAAAFVILVVAFAWLGHQMARRLSPTAFARVVYGFIGLAGLFNITRYFG